MERRPLVRRMRRAQAPRPRRRDDHRQPRHAGLHRAEDALGRDPRARGREGDEARAPAQGLRAPQALGRGGLRNVRRRRARRGSTSASARWDARLLEATGLCSPPCRASSRAPKSRPISPGVAKAWGFEGRKIPIAGGGGDNAASAIGVGATEAGEGFVSLGTSGVIFAVTDRYVSLPERTLHAFCHALPNRWHGMAVMLSAAASLAWIAGVLGREGDVGALVAGAELREVEGRRRLGADLPPLPQRRAHAAQRRRGDGPLRVLARKPRGRRARLRGDGGRRLRLRRRRGRAGRGGRAARAAAPVGGGSRSDVWGQMIADVTGLTIDVARARRRARRLGRRGSACSQPAREPSSRSAPGRRAQELCPERRARRAARPAASALSRALRGGAGGPGRLTRSAPAAILAPKSPSEPEASPCRAKVPAAARPFSRAGRHGAVEPRRRLRAAARPSRRLDGAGLAGAAFGSPRFPCSASSIGASAA